jgi:SAM-dependent methyltransferase
MMIINTEQYEQLLQWLESGLGQRYWEAEQSLYSTYLKELRGNTQLLPAAIPFQALQDGSQFKQKTPFELTDFSKKLIYPDASFDCIVLPHVLEFCSEPRLILLEAQRLLTPEGVLFISGFCFQWMLRILSLFGSDLDRKVAQISAISGSYLKALAHFMGLDRGVISHFYNPKMPFLPGGYLLELRCSEYGVRPLTIQTLRKPLDLMASPSMANLANNRSLMNEKS